MSALNKDTFPVPFIVTALCGHTHFFCSHPFLHAVFWTLCLWTSLFSRVRCVLIEQGMFLGTSMQLAYLPSLLGFDTHCWCRLDNILYFHFHTKWQSSNACLIYTSPSLQMYSKLLPLRYYCVVLQSSWFGKTGTETSFDIDLESHKFILG